MQLESGRRLGPYEIVERVGAGGMGEVYRAVDTRLQRNVAIKVLSSEFGQDAKLRLRFEREARTISSLNHPHICTLHDVGRENGLDYIVLEYCEGQTLAERLERGRLPLDQALQYGIEITDALSRAHHAGVVHRDLKPSNVMLTRSGVKLLDFGLAKQRGVDRSSNQTTSFHDISEEGSFLGTVQYMAPEVLAGAEADMRSDIFSVGGVLYEMVAGKPAFSGPSKANIIAAIVEREPDPLRGVPIALDRLITGCLAKRPDDRWQSAHDIAEQLRTVRDTRGAHPHRRRRAAATALLVTLAAALAAAGVWFVQRNRTPARIVRLDIALPQPNLGERARTTSMWIGSGQQNVAFSPDGKRIAFVAVHAPDARVYVRELDSFDNVPLGTGSAPFFSPDGQWVAFFSNNVLSKVPVTGGSPQKLFSGPRGASRGGTWAPDGTIYFAPGPGTGLWAMNANGGDAREVTRPNASAGENSHRWPHMLPDGEHLLFTIRTDQLTSFDDARIAVLSLMTGAWRVLVDGGFGGRYVEPGYLLFGRAGALYAVPFDLQSLRVTGPRRMVIDGVLTSAWSGATNFDVSRAGDLAYVRGNGGEESSVFLSTDRAGNTKSTISIDVPAGGADLSPSGRKLALVLATANDDIGVYDIDGGLLTRLSFERGDEWSPVWTPDGKAVAYSMSQPLRIVLRNADGSGAPVELVKGSNPYAMSFSPDGSLLLFGEQDPSTGSDLWLLPMRGDRTPQPFLRTPYNEGSARFSPDGKWVAYQSNESGTVQVYVRSLNRDGGRLQLSTEGGRNPTWSFDGKEIFYKQDFDLFSVPVSVVQGEIHAGRPRLLFHGPVFWAYEATKDGFILATYPGELSAPRHVNVVLNWRSDLERQTSRAESSP